MRSARWRWHLKTALASTISSAHDHGLAAYYGIARRLFLRDTGRKLSHMDRQLGSRDAVLRDLHRDLKV